MSASDLTESASSHANLDVPVLLVHGWGGSFETTWKRSGFAALLDDAGRPVLGVDLLGHGTAPKPHDPSGYTDLTTRVVDALPDRPVDAIGFSLGALTLLRLAMASPGRFRRLVLAGIGSNVFERDDEALQRIVAAVRGEPSEDQRGRLFAQYAGQPGNDPTALAAVLEGQRTAITEAQLARVSCRVLVVTGEDDFVHPPDRLVAALPNATAVALRRTDHFATPESFGFIDAALDFIDAVAV